MTAPSTPCVPAGPSARRYPGPNLRISTIELAPRPVSRSVTPALRAAATADRGFGLVAHLAVRALAAQLLVVRHDHGREAEEADPHERRQAGDEGQQDEQEVEPEDAFDQQQPEDDQARPEQPLLQRA